MGFKLKDEILSMSESQYWDTAILEWNFTNAYYSEELQTCLCGHYPIKNICVIKNHINQNQTEVGNCCINKFLSIEEGNNIFSSLKRIKDDNTKSMSIETLEYLFNKRIISNSDYDFYSDIIRKRNLSPKQLNYKKIINNKLIEFTSYENNSTSKDIDMILKWSLNNKWFDTGFTLSIKSKIDKGIKLSDNQKAAINSIILKNKIIE